MTIFSTDTFDRANSAASMGATDGSGTADPMTWTNQFGTFGISSNQATCTAVQIPSPFDAMVLGTLGQSDLVLSCDVQYTSTGGSHDIVFRASDTSNYLRLTMSNTTFQLQKVVGGGPINLTSNLGVIAGPNAVTTITIAANGSNLSVMASGATTIPLASAVESFNQSATQVGFHSNSPNKFFFNNWSVVSPAPSGWYVNQIGMSA